MPLYPLCFTVAVKPTIDVIISHTKFVSPGPLRTAFQKGITPTKLALAVEISEDERRLANKKKKLDELVRMGGPAFV